MASILSKFSREIINKEMFQKFTFPVPLSSFSYDNIVWPLNFLDFE